MTTYSLGHFGLVNPTTHLFPSYYRNGAIGGGTDLFNFTIDQGNAHVHLTYHYQSGVYTNTYALLNSSGVAISSPRTNPQAAGNYTIRATSDSFGSNAEFGFVVHPNTSNYVDEAGETAGTARNLGTITSSLSQSAAFFTVFNRVLDGSAHTYTVDFSSPEIPVDQNDFYKFRITAESNVTITYSSGGHGAVILMGGPQGNFGSSFSQTVTSGQPIHLIAGEYTLEVVDSATTAYPQGAATIEIRNVQWENYEQYSFTISVNSSGGTTSGPDLRADTVALGNSSVAAGGTTTVSYHLYNGGTSTAAPSTSRIYLSTDSTITTSDTVLQTVVFTNSVSAGFFIQDSRTITLPAGLGSGTYYIGVIADHDNQVVESNENNNASSAVAINVTGSVNRPDLQADTVTLNKSSVAAGGAVTVSYHLYNAGNATAAPSNSRIYLSTDSTITTSDTELQTVVFTNSVSAGFFIQDSQTVTLPASLGSGTYYIGVIADHNNQVVESNENNNASAPVAIAVTIPNRAPVANADSYTTGYNTTLTINAPGVLANDTDQDGNTLTVSNFTNPSHGTLSISPAGAIVYTPANGYAGPDSFTYRANDGITNSAAAATVSITVTNTQTVTYPDGSRTTQVWDVQNQYNWANYILNYDPQGRLTGQTTTNDNGTRILYGWDVRNVAPWAGYVINQDAQGRTLNQTTNNDNGTRIIYVWDVLNQATWADYVINQDAQGRWLNQTTNNDNGTRIIYVWDVLNQATWADYVINQDALGRTTSQTVNNDNGTHVIYVWDVLNQATWANYVVNQDALGRTTAQTVNNDNGTHTVYGWDVQNQATWSNYWINYDSQWRALTQTNNNDNGTHTVYGWDVQNQAPWSNYVINQDVQGRALTQITNNDNGTRTVLGWDVQNQAPWSNYVINQDAQGRALTQTTNNDNGTHTVLGWDVQNQFPWANYMINQDVQGRALTQTNNNDNGTRTLAGWDVQNQAAWADYLIDQDSLGRTVKQTNNNDNGTHTVFDYDVQNQYNWTSVTTSYDAQWHQLSQHGVYDNGSVWNI